MPGTVPGSLIFNPGAARRDMRKDQAGRVQKGY